MKKILLLSIIFLLHSFPSFSNPNGKGLVCKCDYVVDDKTYKRKKCDTIYNFDIGFYFKNYTPVKYNVLPCKLEVNQ